MPRAHITKEWIDNLRKEIKAGTFEITTVYNNVIQKAILVFSSEEKPYKLYNMGAGVKKITSNTDTCPCCKRKL